MSRRTYIVRAVRSGDWWALSADVPGAVVHTQARRLDQAEAMARDAISLALDEPADVFDVTVRVDLDEELAGQIADAAERAAAARQAQESASAATRRAVDALRSQGFSVRDVGRLLSLSPQRVSQLAGPAR